VTGGCRSSAAGCCNCCCTIAARKCSSLLSAKGVGPKELPNCQNKKTKGKSPDSQTTKAKGKSPDTHTAKDKGRSPDNQTAKTKGKFNSGSGRNKAQHSNRRSVCEETDSTTESSSESSLLSARGSNPDSDGWTLMSGTCRPNATGSRSTIVWDLDDSNNTCNCRHVEQMRNGKARNRVTKSTERVASTVDGSHHHQSRTSSTPNAHHSNTETLPMMRATVRRRSNDKIKKTDDRDAEEISERTKVTPQNENAVYCCNGECRRYCDYRVVPCDCDKCFSPCYTWTTKNEVATRDTAHDIVETQSTPSKRGSSRSRVSRTETVNQISTRAAAGSSNSLPQTSASEDDYDADRCNDELSSGSLQDDREICPNCNCYRSNYGETTDDVTGDNESTAEVSTIKQQNFTDGARSDARTGTAYSHSDAPCRSGTASVMDGEKCTPLQYDATPICGSPATTQTVNASCQRCFHRPRADRDAAVSESVEQQDRRDDDVSDGEDQHAQTTDDDSRQCCTASPSSVQTADSRTTDVTSSAACSSCCSDSESHESEHVDDDETQTQSGQCPMSGSLQCQVTSVLTAS